MKKGLSVFIAFTLVLTLLAPFTVKAEAALNLNWHSMKNISGGTELIWTTISDGSQKETFIVQKGDKQAEVSAELVDEFNSRSSTERTYKWIDADVKEGETSVYTVMLSENKEVRTTSVPITYTLGGGEVKLQDEGEEIPEHEDHSFVLNIRNEGSKIIVSWPEYKTDKAVEYMLYLESETLGKYTEASEYVLSDAEKGKEYRFKMNVIVEGEVQASKEAAVRAEGTQSKDFTVFLYPLNDTILDASWLYNQAASYNLFLNGKLIEEKSKELTYRFENLSSDTEYEVSVEALDEKGAVLSKSSAKTKTSAAPKGKLIEIKDEAVKRAILDQLGLSRDIVESDMKKLSTLTVSNAEDLAGLEAASNLVRLEVTYSRLNDLNVLSSLNKLEYLDLSYTESGDYTSLKNIPSLKTLNLTGTFIKDLSVLSNLINLQLLSVSQTDVSDLKALGSLKNLEELDISYTQVKSIKDLESVPSLKKVIFFGPGSLYLIGEINSFQNKNVEFITDESLEIIFDSIKPHDNGALLSWSFEGSGKLDHYKLTVNHESIIIPSKKRDMTYEITGLKPDQTYTFKLEAFDRRDGLIGTASSFFKTLKLPAGEKIVFTDKNLEEAIKDHFGFNRDIVASDMEHLTELDLSDKEIKDLTGLEFAVNLHTLMVSFNKIKSIKPIEKLVSLHTLSLDGNPVSNFNPLKKLSKLTFLDLSYTGIKDLSVLSGQSDLQRLLVAGNGLKSLKDMPKMDRLLTLVAAENKFSSLESLQKYENLAHLILWDNPLASLDGLKDFEQVVYLDIGLTKVTDIKELRKLKKLQYVNLLDIKTLDLTYKSENRKVVKELEANNVYVDYNVMLDFYSTAVTENSISVEWEQTGEMEVESYRLIANGKTVKGAGALDSNASGYKINNLTEKTDYLIELAAINKKGEILEKVAIEEKTLSNPVTPKITFKDKNLEKYIKEQLGITRQLHQEDMLKIYTLELENSSVKDLTELKDAENLEWFSVIKNTAPLDLTPLSGLKNVKGVAIDDTEIKDFTVLKNMSLKYLEVYNTELADLSFMKDMENLEFAALSENQISDLSLFASSNLDELISLNLSGNKIKDTEGLQGLAGALESLDLSKNPLENTGGLKSLDSLAFLSMSKTPIRDIEFLLDLTSLEFVSLYGSKSLDFTIGTKTYNTIKVLQDNGVVVEYEHTSNPEIYVNDVSDSSISISWDHMLPQKSGEYLVMLNEDIVTALSGDRVSYTFENLDPDTDYSIEIAGQQNGEIINAAYQEASTLANGQIERVIKEANLYFVDENGNAAENVEFDLVSLDKFNEEFYSFGTSNEEGKLLDLTGYEPKDTFDLLVGSYELYAVTEGGREFVYRFEVEDERDYVKQPLLFLVKSLNSQPNDSSHEDRETVHVPISDNIVQPVKKYEDNKNSNSRLPATASYSFNLLVLGVIFLIVGAGMLVRKNSFK
ncbi:leucine-rich repeat domain-containing protein [Metabacillus indicus]|uniref:Fibronectin type-III domain-containing protein n=1 Tax=Metabacillus indicus TaxID=246786 RepID=A0A084GXW2_METID|nr:leucine-rich repeat domain-containing protein [Metabacillus indicus]KEZ52174.1 hypothetical protein GS18_0213950 [Metabacillus indicus]